MKRFFSVFIRAILVLGAAVFLGIFIFTMTIGIINIGNFAASLLCVWIILVSIKPVHRAIRGKLKNHSFTRLLYRFVSFMFIAFAAYGAVVTGAMLAASLVPPPENATAVVLGAQVRPTGNPSTVLRGRINAAENYLEENQNAAAVLSGGQGADEVMSEAQCMYGVMTADGIGGDRLYVEDKSESTLENFENSLKVIEKNNLNPNIAIATDRSHQLRARIITMKLGIKAEVGAVNSDAPFHYAAAIAVREWFALPYEIIKG